jgi:hypothetical protein
MENEREIEFGTIVTDNKGSVALVSRSPDWPGLMAGHFTKTAYRKFGVMVEDDHVTWVKKFNDYELTGFYEAIKQHKAFWASYQGQAPTGRSNGACAYRNRLHTEAELRKEQSARQSLTWRLEHDLTSKAARQYAWYRLAIQAALAALTKNPLPTCPEVK